MKRNEIIASVVIIGITIIIVSMIAIHMYSGTGCGCIRLPGPPIMALDRINNSTGSYVNLTYVDSRDVKEVKDLRLWSVPVGDNSTFPGWSADENRANNWSGPEYLNTTLVPGNSYIFKVKDTSPRHVVVLVNADGFQEVVIDKEV